MKCDESCLARKNCCMSNLPLYQVLCRTGRSAREFLSSVALGTENPFFLWSEESLPLMQVCALRLAACWAYGMKVCGARIFGATDVLLFHLRDEEDDEVIDAMLLFILISHVLRNCP